MSKLLKIHHFSFFFKKKRTKKEKNFLYNDSLINIVIHAFFFLGLHTTVNITKEEQFA